MLELEKFSPPHGRLLLAEYEGQVAGLTCMRRIRESIGEIKRMYVRPEFRGKGIGRALLERLVDEAREIGYPRIRLDSARFMEEAHSLYRSTGFQEIGSAIGTSREKVANWRCSGPKNPSGF
jgi:GNAT superfamily N-acetyltransferase